MDVTHAIEVVRMTDVGLVRDHNEDAVASDLSIGLVILADGMGGYQAGEIASEVAILSLTADLAELHNRKRLFKKKNKLLPESSMLIEAVDNANAAIYQMAQAYQQCEGMGTTLVTGLFTDNKLVVGHIGDSRLYCLRDKKLLRLTEDHSVVQEQINAGEITEEQAKKSENRNLVTRALGTNDFVEVEIKEYEAKVNDIYLLCTDGLTDLVDDEAIASILIDAYVDIDQAAKNLIHLANVSGGIDNISVVIALVKKEFPLKKQWLRHIFGKVVS